MELAEFWAYTQGWATREFQQARIEGRMEKAEVYAFDGLMTMAKTASHPGEADGGGRPVSPVKVIVRVDWDSLIRGYPIAGETCEIAGLGPVPVPVVQAMMGTGDPFLAAVVTKGHDVINVAHLGRKPLAHQQTALQWLDPTCPVKGCNTSVGLQIDHVQDWSKTKVTILGSLRRPCAYHHNLKTRDNWQLIPGPGKQPMVPPGHPQHPDTPKPAPARTGPVARR
jgi:hypothetical protein